MMIAPYFVLITQKFICSKTVFVLWILTCSVGLFSCNNDSLFETSATAIYTYSVARAINRGWIDKKAYGPMVLLAWNAVASKINANGQVEGTCVGTGLGFDPAFYYYRQGNVYAAHEYGPVLLAGPK